MTVFENVEAELIQKGYTFERKDYNRPWGGFIVLNERHKEQFIQQYFSNIPKDTLDVTMKLCPKMLFVAPGQRLSWQYHYRRSEVWQVYQGEVGIIKSDTDEPNPIKTYSAGDQVILKKGVRHRLVGLNDWGLVAEIWVHTDSDKPSDEDDIVRLQDDYARETPRA